ncbi:MAG: 6,7-dimethyl-8-ribityllumazine synthase [Pseudomonadota bacterium]
MNQTYLPQNQKIAFIQAGWHSDIVAEASKSFIADMKGEGYAENSIEIFDVPGSLEIPLQAQKLAQTGDYAIIVACGFVINGGIYRHDFVASTVIDAMMRVQLDTGIPVLSVVLTPHHFHGSEEHHKFFFDHFKIKGKEAAEACVATLKNMSAFDADLKQAA